MSTQPQPPSSVSTEEKTHHSTFNDSEIHDPSLPPQRHAGKIGLGPNYPLGPSLTDKLEGIAEEVEGKILHRPELIELGHERRTGELRRKEREREDGADPFKTS